MDLKSILLRLPFVLAILPEGAVKDETSFLVLAGMLAVLVAAAIVLRYRKRNEAV